MARLRGNVMVIIICSLELIMPGHTTFNVFMKYLNP